MAERNVWSIINNNEFWTTELQSLWFASGRALSFVGYSKVPWNIEGQ